MTPRKFYAMLHVALEYNKAKYSSNKDKNKNNVVDGNVDDLKW